MSEPAIQNEPTYRTSSFSVNGSCVEVAQTKDGGPVVIRNSRERELGSLTFTAKEWAAFVAGVKAGEFDLT